MYGRFLRPLALLALLAPTQTYGQSVAVPNVVVQGSENLVDQGVTVPDAEAAPLPAVRIEFATQRPPANSTVLEFDLVDIDIDGPEILPRNLLRPTYEHLIGKRISLKEAFAIIDEILALHREAGFVFTRAIAPPQTIDNGVFRITIVEAKVGNVLVEEPEGSVGELRPLIESMAQRLANISNPTISQVERTLLLINDIPGIVKATAVPRAGDEDGTVDFFINVVRDPFSGVFFVNHRQSPILGPGLVGVSLEAASYSAQGDTTKVSLFNAFGDNFEEDLKERNTFQVEHQRHLGADGLIAKARFLVSRTRPGDDLTALEIEGLQVNGGIEFEYPIIRTRRLSVWGQVGLGFDNNTIDASGGDANIVDDKLRTLHVGGRILQRDDLGYTRAEGQIRQGLDVFGASGENTFSSSRVDGKSEFFLLRGQIEREVFVPSTEQAVSIYGLALGQYSFDTLLSGEEFAIGGGQIGRGYDQSEFTGDSGYGVLGELRYQTSFELQEYPIGVQVYGFGDFSEIYNRGDSGQPDREDLTSYGGGVRLSLPKNLTFEGQVAMPTNRLQRTPSEKKAPRFFFNLVKQF